MKRRREILSIISKNDGLSDFEKAVYCAALDIPPGTVRTYKWLADRIGRPKASRAVGNALNKNPYAPMVPCHRVVKSDGSIGGYAKGTGLKIRILKKEGVLLRPHTLKLR